jgi:hypothetical protein
MQCKCAFETLIIWRLWDVKNYDIWQLNVLLVEKHNYMRRIMRNILSEMGVESIVDTAKPDHALKIFQEG